MKRILLYIVILAGVLLVPVQRLDVGKLKPVQAVWISKEGDRIILKTDTEDVGTGATVEEAFEDLEANCIGIIYLNTAQYLLVSDSAADLISPLSQHLKGSVDLCKWDGQGSVEDAAKYMAAHKNGCRLKDWKAGEKLPALHLKTTK